MRITNEIKSFARRKGLKVYQHSIKEIEKSFIEGRKLNKRNLIEEMVRRYPHLHQDLKKEKSHRNPYCFRAFEAVVAASENIIENQGEIINASIKRAVFWPSFGTT